MPKPTSAPSPRRRVLRAATATLCVLAASISTGWAQQDYPTRPITLVMPFPPGGGGDAQARVLAQALGEKLGQSVIVDNRPGAGTAIGAAYVANARPDGYTLLLSSNSTYTMNPAIRQSLPYDSVKSFQPIGVYSRVGLVLLANATVPVHTVQEFMATVKADPQKYSYASFGAGTSSHFAAELVLQAMGLKMTHIPYKGSAPAMTDLIGGQLPFSFDTMTAAVPQVKAGKVKAIAVTTAQRSALLPSVPTFAESGLPGVTLDAWGMMAAPRGTPAAVVAKLEKALQETMATPSVREALAKQGVEASFLGAAQSAQLLEAELPRMRAVAARANIQVE